MNIHNDANLSARNPNGIYQQVQIVSKPESATLKLAIWFSDRGFVTVIWFNSVVILPFLSWEVKQTSNSRVPSWTFHLTRTKKVSLDGNVRWEKIGWFSNTGAGRNTIFSLVKYFQRHLRRMKLCNPPSIRNGDVQSYRLEHLKLRRRLSNIAL